MLVGQLPLRQLRAGLFGQAVFVLLALLLLEARLLGLAGQIGASGPLGLQARRLDLAPCRILRGAAHLDLPCRTRGAGPAGAGRCDPRGFVRVDSRRFGGGLRGCRGWLWRGRRAGSRRRVEGEATSGRFGQCAGQLAEPALRKPGVDAPRKLLQKALEIFRINGVLDVLPVQQLHFLGHRRGGAGGAGGAAGRATAPGAGGGLRRGRSCGGRCGRVERGHCRCARRAGVVHHRRPQPDHEVSRRCIAQVTVLGQRLGHHRVDARRHAQIECRRRRRVLLRNRLHDREVVGAFKGLDAGQQLVEDHAGGEQIGPRVHLQALHLLGRHVLQGADHRALGSRGIARVGDTGDAEITELDPSTGIEHHVGRLDVAVDDALLVREAQCRQQLAHDGERAIEGQPVADVELLLQVSAPHQFHDHEGHALIAAGVIDTDDVGMLKPSSGTCLRPEARLVLGRHVLGQLVDANGLDRDVSVQVGIVRLIDKTHPALFQGLDDVIPA